MFGPMPPGGLGQTSTTGNNEVKCEQVEPALFGTYRTMTPVFLASTSTVFGGASCAQPQQQTTSLFGTQKDTAQNTSLLGVKDENPIFGAVEPADFEGFGQLAAKTSIFDQASTSQATNGGRCFKNQKPAFGGVNAPMSLKPIPVCNNCSRCTEKSISCTSCYRMCCVLCFNLQTDLAEAVTEEDKVDAVRLCPKCIGSLAAKPEPMDQPCTSTRQDPELCELHGKPHKLYCLNCSVCICGDCLSEKQHEMHHVNNLVVVYQEKLAEVERKLAETEHKLASSSVYERNLEKLENEEQSIMKAVLTMKQKAISGLSSMTAKRKATLKSKVSFYADKRNRLSKLRETVKQLTARDFLTKRSAIDRQCDGMVIEFTPKCELESVDDFKCDLIPSYTFANLLCTGFSTRTSGCVFRVNSAYDVAWGVNVSKLLAKLQVKLNPTDAGLLKFAHKLIVIIPHKEDPTKEIRKTFDVGSSFHTFEIVETSHLEKHGFFQDGGNLLLKVGIRPLNALIEKALLDFNCEKLKAENSNLKAENSNLKAENSRLNAEQVRLIDEQSSLKAESSTLKSQLQSIRSAFDYEYWTSQFIVSLAMLNSHYQYISTTNIVDGDGRLWVLRVGPTLINPAHVEVYITLVSGSPTKSDFFVELKHQDVHKSIVKSGSSYFHTCGSSGWNCFITWNQILDVGFHPDGSLRFRFGVKPLPN